MAKFYLPTEQYTLAMKYIRQALEIAEEKLPQDHPAIVDYKRTLEIVSNENVDWLSLILG